MSRKSSSRTYYPDWYKCESCNDPLFDGQPEVVSQPLEMPRGRPRKYCARPECQRRAAADRAARKLRRDAGLGENEPRVRPGGRASLADRLDRVHEAEAKARSDALRTAVSAWARQNLPSLHALGELTEQDTEMLLAAHGDCSGSRWSEWVLGLWSAQVRRRDGKLLKAPEWGHVEKQYRKPILALLARDQDAAVRAEQAVRAAADAHRKAAAQEGRDILAAFFGEIDGQPRPGIRDSMHTAEALLGQMFYESQDRKALYRDLARRAHPDAGGNPAVMGMLAQAWSYFR